MQPLIYSSRQPLVHAAGGANPSTVASVGDTCSPASFFHGDPMRCVLRLFVTLLMLCFTAKSYGYQLATPQDLAIYRALLPKTNEPQLRAVFDNPNTLWYTEKEMPRSYQHDMAHSQRLSFHSAYYKMGPDPMPTGKANGNLEWPWSSPQVKGGDNEVKNLVGLLLPDRPVVVFRKPIPFLSRVSSNSVLLRYEPRYRDGYAWMFPVGTVIVEIITNRVGQYDVCFKVFQMTRTDTDWERAVYRPFETAEEYAEAIGREVNVSARVSVLRDAHPQNTFEEQARVFTIAPIDPSLTLKLLTQTPFKRCKTDDFIPGSEHQGQIVPRGYLGMFYGNGIDQSKCKNCHKDVLSHVQKFEGGDWYGLIRGADHVFSFNPADPSCVSSRGAVLPFRLHRGMASAGLIAMYDSRVHRAPHYGEPL